MIPEGVENRIARYFFHHYLPDEIMYELVDLLIPQCLNVEDEEDLDEDTLVMECVILLHEQLDGKSMK